VFLAKADHAAQLLSVADTGDAVPDSAVREGRV
jgi:hypothetical protein